MAHPADTAPSSPVFAHARLTPEEADRLASTFRPSWELDDAPFTGAGNLTEADMRALQSGGGVRAEVRATALQAPVITNGNGASHAIPAAAATEPVLPSIVIEPTPPPVPVRANKTMMGVQAPTLPTAPPVAAAPVVAEAPRVPPARPSQRPAAPEFVIGPPTPPSRPAVARPAPSAASRQEFESFPKKSKTGLFVAIGGIAVVLLGAGIIWATSSSSDTASTTPAATATAKPQSTEEDKLSSIPPPPPATTTVAPPPAVATATPAVTTAIAAATTTPPAPAPVAALPAAPARTAYALPPPVPHPVAVAPPPAAVPKPAAKKGGQTIVRDVPF